jgi:lysophospholipase L1-like esterase
MAIMRRHGFTSTWITVAALMLGVALSGCSETANAPGREGEGAGATTVPARTSVVMIGDSITDGARAGLEFAFSAKGFTDVTVDAQWGRRISVGDGVSVPLNGLQAVKDLQAQGADPDVWVVALGTNDLGLYRDAAAYAEVIDQMLALLPVDKPLVWVNTFRANQLGDTVVYNSTLAERLALRGNAVLTDWFAIASAPDQEVLTDDGVHPTRDGYGIFALTVADSLATLTAPPAG